MRNVTGANAAAPVGASGRRAARAVGLLAAVPAILLLTGLLPGLLTALLPGLLPGAVPGGGPVGPVPAAAQQPYGPVVLDVTVDEGADRDRLALRVTGLRPNSSLVAVASGGVRVTGVADGAGVAVLSVELPTVVDVEVRGIAADGLPLVLLETVAFPRFQSNGVNGVVQGAGPSGGLLGLSWALAVIGVGVGAVSAFRLRTLRATLAGASEPQSPSPSGPPPGEGDPG